MYYDFVRLYFGTDLDCIKFVSEFVFVIRVSHELLAIIAITFHPLSLTYYILCISVETPCAKIMFAVVSTNIPHLGLYVWLG